MNTKIFEYDCENTSECYPFHIFLIPGTYRIECYGAQGGSGLRDKIKNYPGGKGAYVSGILSNRKPLFLYLYIGGKGSDASRPNREILGGWNGGGNGKYEESDDDDSGAGGGATDIRLIGGQWNDTKSLQSRIMVAAGGSGSAYGAYGAPGGDITGYFTNVNNGEAFIRSTTNQTHGYLPGIGENGADYQSTSYKIPYSGGGAGYFGGSNRYPLPTIASSSYNAIASSGSSYISGFQVPGILKDPQNSSCVYSSGISFRNPKMINGFNYMPSLDGNTQMRGKEGNGAIKITILMSYSCQCKSIFHLSFLCSFFPLFFVS